MASACPGLCDSGRLGFAIMAVSVYDLPVGWFLLDPAEAECPGRGRVHPLAWSLAGLLGAMVVPANWRGFACSECGHQVAVDDDGRARRR